MRMREVIVYRIYDRDRKEFREDYRISIWLDSANAIGAAKYMEGNLEIQAFKLVPVEDAATK